ncbi:phage tail sheath subtilisin-like domain-containing protein [Erythrobacter litoralis]|uniref:Phage tail sheath protein, putative n=1 Tax=Erythrobacter litoralis (strain HTCC2594) TaxID=314225 RepID=Q2N8P2_ERYLH|nr:phage tail sheath subtilisin-like domain-containing protein [Erythrobacter litoralis]ABC63949.1 phage tail sheath protein, putative [Erythrobacter litoralis HTCC2594]
MPEYLAPGVFVEEVSYRAKSIEGVSTTTTGFVGPTRYGPLDLEPEIITSLVEFERLYGGSAQLDFQGTAQDNYMWNAARAFFQEGGKRLYVARAFRPVSDANDGRASRATALHGLNYSARFPGNAGNGRLSLQFNLGPNRFVLTDGEPEVKGISHGDIVYVSGDNVDDAFYLATWDPVAEDFTFDGVDSGSNPLSVDLSDDSAFTAEASIQRLTVSILFESVSTDIPSFAMVDLPLDPQHRANGRPDSLLSQLGDDLPNAGDARRIPIAITPVAASHTGLEIANDFISDAPADPTVTTVIYLEHLIDEESDPSQLTVTIELEGGGDGLQPESRHYEGEVDTTTNAASGLKAFENLEDISIVAAPGSSVSEALGQPVANALISHARRMKYRIAVIDSVQNQSISAVRNYRAKFDSKYAAFYYPWVRIIDPVTGQENHYPPSGFVAGIYARNDVERAVYKAPANEVVNLALGFEKTINTGQQEVLNPEAINCFRFFEGRGNRLWGARTMTSDPEWKYVNLRRYFAYLERSIDKGTQWAVFEPNGERLWANVRRTIEDFLLNEFQNGALLGERPEHAYFVKCDRSTMTQNDIDNGRLVCQVGVAALKPAEFVIFRIGQWTADSKA